MALLRLYYASGARVRGARAQVSQHGTDWRSYAAAATRAEDGGAPHRQAA